MNDTRHLQLAQALFLMVIAFQQMSIGSGSAFALVAGCFILIMECVVYLVGSWKRQR